MKQWPKSRTRSEINCWNFGSEKASLKKWCLNKNTKFLRELVLKIWGKSSPSRGKRRKGPGACIVQNNWTNWIHIPFLHQNAKLNKQSPFQGQRRKVLEVDFEISPFYYKSSCGWDRDCLGTTCSYDTFRTCQYPLLEKLVHILCLQLNWERERVKLNTTLFKTTLIQGL